MTEWFEEWFNEEYLHLYAHRNRAEARDAVALVRRSAGWSDGGRVLDLACGSGRHAHELAEGGARVIGFDLSLPLLKRARQQVAAPFVRGDMRQLPFTDGVFDLAVNLFTSFGYFDEDREHRGVVREIARVLKPSGKLFLDFLNAARVRAELVPHEEQSKGDRRVAIERRLSPDGRYVIKEIHLVGQGRRYLERVRLFAPQELQAMLSESGFTVTATFGDYRGGPLATDSDRVILVAQKA